MQKYVEMFDAESTAKDKKLKDARSGSSGGSSDEIQSIEEEVKNLCEAGITLRAGQELDLYQGD